MLQDKYETKTDDYYGNYRQDILPLVPKHVRKVLEIGCGTGNTLAYLKDNGYCDWVCGVELFPNAAREAALKLDNLYEDNVEEMRLPIDPASIDMILCLDVLEHLVNPEKVVAYLHTLLTPGGIIIASIPNVRHYTASFPLLFQDKWDYKSDGILDVTHLRFFVRKTAIKLMESSGLVVEIAMPNVLGKTLRTINNCSFHIFESFFAIQYLIRATNTIVN